MPSGAIEFIEFHDGQVEPFQLQGGDLVILFEHIYVCLRSADDHAGWSYRARLELAGVSNVRREGDLDPFAPRAENDRLPWVSDAEVLDANSTAINVLALLHGSAACRFWMFLYNDSEAVRLSADVVRATLVLGDAVKRIETCDFEQAAR